MNWGFWVEYIQYPHGTYNPNGESEREPKISRVWVEGHFQAKIEHKDKSVSPEQLVLSSQFFRICITNPKEIKRVMQQVGSYF